ncbi:hypothetical protein JZU57_00195, partial [bacterium]|nr:hypothetical protein [bacterium]
MDNDGVQVDFKMEQVKQHPSTAEQLEYMARHSFPSEGADQRGNFELPPRPTDPRTVTWSALFKFKIEGDGKLKLEHSVVGNLRSDNETSTGGRIARGIFSLGLSELGLYFEGGAIDQTMKQAFDPNAQLAEL